MTIHYSHCTAANSAAATPARATTSAASAIDASGIAAAAATAPLTCWLPAWFTKGREGQAPHTQSYRGDGVDCFCISIRGAKSL